MTTSRHLADLPVPPVGYGAMVLIGLYGASDEATGLAALRHVLDRGAGFIDTSDGYGDNEELVGRALAGAATRPSSRRSGDRRPRPGRPPRPGLLRERDPRRRAARARP
jgi:hypothetical protein